MGKIPAVVAMTVFALGTALSLFAGAPPAFLGAIAPFGLGLSLRRPGLVIIGVATGAAGVAWVAWRGELALAFLGGGAMLVGWDLASFVLVSSGADVETGVLDAVGRRSFLVTLVAGGVVYAVSWIRISLPMWSLFLILAAGALAFRTFLQGFFKGHGPDQNL